MKRMTLLLVLSLFVVGVAEARKCPPKCSHRLERGHRCEPAKDGLTFLQHFALTAGFRWDRECPELDERGRTAPRNDSGFHDPFFVGAELRLPLGTYADFFGGADFDLEDQRWGSGRLGVAVRPWAR